jgi:hypothetical protein
MSPASKLFIERNYSSNEKFFLVAARYAHLEFIDNLLGSIVDSYGEAFNSTYESHTDSIVITNKSEFERIVKEVVAKAETALNSASLPSSNFMKLTFYTSLFDPNVLKEVLKIC